MTLLGRGLYLASVLGFAPCYQRPISQNGTKCHVTNLDVLCVSRLPSCARTVHLGLSGTRCRETSGCVIGFSC